MGWDHSLSCKECREKLIIARNNKLYKEPKNIVALEQFLVKHADHELIFDADDNWVRVPDCTFFKTKEEITKEELEKAFA
jgi:hypothetical protein